MSVNPSGGRAITSLILFAGSATTSLINEPTSGRARAVGTGVTKPIHKLESPGVNTGIFIMMRFFNPDTFANFCIMSAYVNTSGPPISKIFPTGCFKAAAFFK